MPYFGVSGRDYNNNFPGYKKESDVRSWSDQMVIADSKHETNPQRGDYRLSVPQLPPLRNAFRHPGESSNTLFLDGHAESQSIGVLIEPYVTGSKDWKTEGPWRIDGS